MNTTPKANRVFGAQTPFGGAFAFGGPLGFGGRFVEARRSWVCRRQRVGADLSFGIPWKRMYGLRTDDITRVLELPVQLRRRCYSGNIKTDMSAVQSAMGYFQFGILILSYEQH